MDINYGKFNSPVDKTIVTKAWKIRGFSCELWTDPPGQEWNDFQHKTDELVVVLEGKIKISMNGMACNLEPGDEVFIPKNTKHTVKNISSGTALWLYGYN